jgi:hypothetical protein
LLGIQGGSKGFTCPYATPLLLSAKEKEYVENKPERIPEKDERNNIGRNEKRGTSVRRCRFMKNRQSHSA